MYNFLCDSPCCGLEVIEGQDELWYRFLNLSLQKMSSFLQIPFDVHILSMINVLDKSNLSQRLEELLFKQFFNQFI